MLKNIFFAHNLETDANSINFGKTKDDGMQASEAELPVDLIRTGNKLIIRTPIVGANADDINIIIENNILTITKNSLREEPETSEYFSLNPIGTLVWEGIGKGDSVSALIKKIVKAYGQPEKQATQDVLELVDDLIKQALIHPRT